MSNYLKVRGTDVFIKLQIVVSQDSQDPILRKKAILALTLGYR